MPTISVIIPTYNSEKTIQKTIESVFKQTFTDFELIVINDGSEDGTLDIILQFNDPRVQVFSYPHAGGNFSRNRGLEAAVGKFVSFLDADDIWTPDKLARQFQALQENESAKVAYSWTDYIDESGKFLLSGTHITANGDVYEQLLVTNFLENGSNPLIYREALIELGGFDKSLSAGQDWDMWLRLAQKFNFVAVPSVHILYRISPGTVSSNLTRQEKACLLVLKRAYQVRPSIGKHTWSISVANFYKYLTCKALQQPFNRRKGITAFIFLWKFIINDTNRIKHTSLTIKMLLKITIIIFFTSNLSTVLLTNTKIKAKEVKKTLKYLNH